MHAYFTGSSASDASIYSHVIEHSICVCKPAAPAAADLLDTKLQ
jgi:hypothetical protein